MYNLRGHHRCGHCQACEMSMDTKDYIHPKGICHVELNHFSTCSSRNVIYMVQCCCLKVYVGSSMRLLHVRILEHWAWFCNRVLEAPLVSHFVEIGHSCKGLRYCVIDQYHPLAYNRNNIQKMLQQWELFWIFKMHSVAQKVWIYVWITCTRQTVRFIERVGVASSRYDCFVRL